MSCGFRARLPFVILGLATLSWYVYTLAPSLVWADGGRLQTDAVTGASLYWHFDEFADIPTDGWPFDRLGVAAWDHPLWVMLGHGLVSFGIGDPAWLLNLLSAVPAALAVVVLFAVIRGLTGDSWGAAAGCVALAVSHVYWFHAVTAEVYALHALFMALLIWLALRQTTVTSTRLASLAFVAGLGLANHIMLALTAVPVGVYVVTRYLSSASGERSSLRWPDAARAGALFALGLLPWLMQFVRMARIVGLDTAVRIASGFPWLGDRWPGPIGTHLLTDAASYFAIMLYQFTPIGLALGAFGVLRLWRQRRPEAVLLVVLFSLHAIFSVNYQVADRFALHLPSFVIFAIFIGRGVSAITTALAGASVRRRVMIGGIAVSVMVTPVAIYAAVPDFLRDRGFTDADFGIPAIGVDGRDGMEYFLNPNQRGDDSAARFGRLALEGVATDALVLVGWPNDLEPYVVMRYFQLTQGVRPDVEFDLMLFSGMSLPDSVLAVAAAQHACRPIYLMSDNAAWYPIEELRHQFIIVTDGRLLRLIPIRSTDQPCTSHDATPAKLDDLLGSVRRS